MALPKGPAQEQIEKLDAVFGEEYFEHGRLLVTVARDVPGTMKVAHRLQGLFNEKLGAMVEVIYEHVKHELWVKLHEATATVGLQKGPEVPECQVTSIPDGVRTNPYRREHLPTLEVFLLWEDNRRATRGHCLYTLAHPEAPQLEQVDQIFAEIEPYFAKRWLEVELVKGAPVRSCFDDDQAADPLAAPPAEEAAVAAAAPYESLVGAGVAVTVLACHPFGFAREQSDAAAPHVRHCRPMTFQGVSNDAGRAKVCFLPADVNKVQVAETERFHGAEVVLPKADLQGLDCGPTRVTVQLTPKALAAVTVHVFELPAELPAAAEETDGIVDWAQEPRKAVEGATVEVTQLRDADANIPLTTQDGGRSFAATDGGLPEGCVSLVVRCAGFATEDRTLMLLAGANEFYVPMRAVVT